MFQKEYICFNCSNYTDDLFEVLDHQDELQTKYTGGTVVHIYAGERIQSLETMKSLVKKIEGYIDFLQNNNDFISNLYTHLP